MDGVALRFALEWDAASIAGLVALGVAVGLLSGLFGVGGGFLLTPMLNVLFGVPYDLAVGSTLVQMALMAWAGTVQHTKLGHVDYKLAMSLLAGAFAGAEAGVRLQGALKRMAPVGPNGPGVWGFDLAMALIFAALLGFIGTGMVVEARRARRLGREASHAAAPPGGSDSGAEIAAARDGSGDPCGSEGEGSGEGNANTRAGGNGVRGSVQGFEPRASAVSRFFSGIRVRPVLTFSSDPARRFSFWAPAGLGFVAGVLTGLLGTGGGVINVPLLIYVLGVPTVVAVGTASVQTAIVSAYGGVRHLMLGNVVWLLVVCVLAGSLAGVGTGAKLSERVPRDRLRFAFGCVVLATALIVALDVCRKLVTF